MVKPAPAHRVGKTGMFFPMWDHEHSIRNQEKYLTVIRLAEMGMITIRNEEDLEYIERLMYENKRWSGNRFENDYKDGKRKLRNYIVHRLLEKEELLYWIDRNCEIYPEFYVKGGVKKCKK